MDPRQSETARKCLHAAHEGTLDFPSIVRLLLGAGFESYSVDYRRSTTTYYLPNGDNLELSGPKTVNRVALRFDSDSIGQAVREAQTNAPGYSYSGFCEKVTAAGCAGYWVSFLGKRVVYYGRTAETHLELFPQ